MLLLDIASPASGIVNAPCDGHCDHRVHIASWILGLDKVPAGIVIVAGDTPQAIRGRFYFSNRVVAHAGGRIDLRIGRISLHAGQDHAVLSVVGIGRDQGLERAPRGGACLAFLAFGLNIRVRIVGIGRLAQRDIFV